MDAQLIVVGMGTAGLGLGVADLAQQVLGDGLREAVLGVDTGRAGADEQRWPLARKARPEQVQQLAASGVGEGGPSQRSFVGTAVERL